MKIELSENPATGQTIVAVSLSEKNLTSLMAHLELSPGRRNTRALRKECVTSAKRDVLLFVSADRDEDHYARMEESP